MTIIMHRAIVVLYVLPCGAFSVDPHAGLTATGLLKMLRSQHVITNATDVSVGRKRCQMLLDDVGRKRRQMLFDDDGIVLLALAAVQAGVGTLCMVPACIGL